MGDQFLRIYMNDQLALGILWREVARRPDVDFDDLIERAEWQRAELEPFRSRCGREALASDSPANP